MNRLYMFGGSSNLRDTWEWDGKNWAQLVTQNAPSARFAPYIVYDTVRRRVVLFGGQRLNDTWELVGPEPLTGTPAAISIATGGAHTFTLDAGPSHGGRLYWIFGSLTGTAPGVSLGSVFVPLNPDPYTDITITLANSAVLATTRGILDAQGMAQAALHVPVINDPTAVGVVLHHAYLVYDANANYYLASNPVRLQLVK